MKEYAFIIVPAVAWVLFALGGTGFKWARRFVLPLFLGVAGAILGLSVLKAILLVLVLIVALCLPYGSNSPIFVRILTISAYSAAFLVVKVSPFCLIPALTFGLLYWLSLKYNWLTWKIVEGSAGLSMGITLLLLV